MDKNCETENVKNDEEGNVLLNDALNTFCSEM